MEELTELIVLSRSGNEPAFEKLLKKYSNLLLSMSRKYSDMCPEASKDNEDFLQEAKLAFYDAVMAYELGSQTTFGAYAKVCVKNKLVSCVRTLTSKKRMRKNSVPEKEAVSDVSDTAISNERKTKLYSLARRALSEYEYSIFKRYSSGERAKEISAKIGKSEKSVNNAIYRIKAKLSRLISDDT